MTWEDARELFLRRHTPGCTDVYMTRIGPHADLIRVQSSGPNGYEPTDFEVVEHSDGHRRRCVPQ